MRCFESKFKWPFKVYLRIENLKLFRPHFEQKYLRIRKLKYFFEAVKFTFEYRDNTVWAKTGNIGLTIRIQ